MLDTEAALGAPVVKWREHVCSAIQIWKRLLNTSDTTTKCLLLVEMAIQFLFGYAASVLEHALSKSMILPLDPLILSSTNGYIEGAGTHTVGAFLALLGLRSMHTGPFTLRNVYQFTQKDRIVLVHDNIFLCKDSSGQVRKLHRLRLAILTVQIKSLVLGYESFLILLLKLDSLSIGFSFDCRASKHFVIHVANVVPKHRKDAL